MLADLAESGPSGPSVPAPSGRAGLALTTAQREVLDAAQVPPADVRVLVAEVARARDALTQAFGA